MLVKVSRACFRWLEISRNSASSLADELSASIIRSSLGELVADGSATAVGRSCFSETEVLELIAFLLSRTSSQSEIPRQYLLVIANRMKARIGGPKSETSDVCVRILKKLASRYGVSSLGPVLFGIGLDLVLDPDLGVDSSTMCEVLPKPAVSMLVSREPSSRPKLVSKPEVAEFSAVDFTSVFAALSKRDSSVRAWRRLCSTIQTRSHGESGESSVPSTTPSNVSLFHKTVRQAAAWCVQNRLRTHFGGPAQTFSSIERLLMAHAHPELDVESAFSSDDTVNEKRIKSRNAVNVSLSKSMVLEFVSALEVYISNAAFVVSEEQRDPDSEAYKTLMFYRANKRVCEDWLSRIRPLLLDISEELAIPDLARHHAHAIVSASTRRLTRLLGPPHTQSPSTSLGDIQHSTNDLDSALFVLCRSFCETKDVDSIVGFEKWRDSLSSALGGRVLTQTSRGAEWGETWDQALFPWIKAVRLAAEMRYEDAAVEYEGVLSGLFSGYSMASGQTTERAAEILSDPGRYLRVSPGALLGCLKHCAACYSATRSWSKLRAFVTKVLALVASLEERESMTSALHRMRECCSVWRIELNWISALEATENETSQDLPISNEGLKGELSALKRWEILDEQDRRHVVHQDFKFDVAEDYVRLRADLVSLAMQPSVSSPIAGEFVGKGTERVLLRLLELSPNTQGWLSSPASFDVIEEVIAKAPVLNPAWHDSGSWSKSLFGRASALPSLGCSTDVQRNEVSVRHLVEVARLARKQRNFELAARVLGEAASLPAGRCQELVILERSHLLSSLGFHSESSGLLQQLCEQVVVASYSGWDGAVRIEPLLRQAEACDQPQTLEHMTFMNSLVNRVEFGMPGGLSELTMNDPIDLAQDMKAKLLAIATKIEQSSSRVWLQYSNWCYAKAKQETERIAARNGYVEMNAAEEARLVYLLDALRLDKSDRDAVVRCFLHMLDDDGLVAQRYENLRHVCLLRAPVSVDQDVVDQIVSLQQTCHSRALRFHKIAVDGYGKYLAAAGTSNPHGREQTTSVVLRILRLLTRFGAEQVVASAVEDAFEYSPTAPWRKIVPQLLSRAAHPVSAVASLIGKVLRRLAHHSPRLVVYPALVDSLSARSNAAESSGLGEAGKLEAVLEELRAESGDLVSGVRLLVTELQRISVLWDEAWISTLHKLSADVSRRANTLEKEAARVDKNLSLSLDEKVDLARRKFVAIMKPILVSVERLWDETCGQAGDLEALTPHERLFLHHYGRLIEGATSRLREACNADTIFDVTVGLPGPSFVWNPFVEILKSLQTSTGRNESLPLDEISPAMASVSSKHLSINMPGILSSNAENASDATVSVREIRSTVMVLRTKTKPKCLEFVGSDGKLYKYLLKAREDLRLDERIMQFLKTVNEFLKTDSFAAARDLSAQNYSVIPLSRDSGLIQMIPDVTPMFQVFLNWNDQSSSSNNSSSRSTVPESPVSKTVGASTSSHALQQQSPTAAFYAKLKQYGITDVSPNQRQQWPESVLRQVYHDLVAQRPRSILQQEIALASGDIRESWSKIARLSKSLAVMSALGYVVGLGDRHLDNILLCSKSGDVLHIDYNVCFDKGLKLKVPEIVPFRLTPMLQDALGVTGVEGKFRVAFETVLRVVRADETREALLTLLEAFVYEPLVDWTGEETRKGVSEDLKSRLEVNVNLSLFLSRAEERRHDATAFEHELDAALTELCQSLDSLPDQVAGLFEDATELGNLDRLETKLSAELVCLEEQRAEYETLYAKCFGEVSAAESRCEEVKTRLADFAAKCLKKHEQIVAWKRGVAPDSSLHTRADTLAATPQASFTSLCSQLFETASSLPGSLLTRDLFASLHAKCQVVDTGVVHAKFSLESVMASLRPWLASYSRCRQDVDAFVRMEIGSQENDIYWLWWRRCDVYLKSIEAMDVKTARDLMSSATQAASSLVASRTQVSESVQMVQRLEHLEQHSSSIQSDYASKNASTEELFENQVQHLFATLSALKLSNAQGQRLLKLTGATWIVTQIDRCQRERPSERRNLSQIPVLSESTPFNSLLGAAKACAALLDLVATPKGAMKRSRATDLLAAVAVDGVKKENGTTYSVALGRLFEVLGCMQDVYAAIDENVIAGTPEKRLKRDATRVCIALVSRELSTGNGSVQDVLDAASTCGEKVSRELTEVFEACPAIRQVLQTVSAMLNQFESLVEGGLGIVDALSESEKTSWVVLVLEICSVQSDSDLEVQSAAAEPTAREMFLSHATRFLQEHVAKVFEQILSGIVLYEWKFAFNVQDDRSHVLERWAAFATSQIPDIFPSTPALPAHSRTEVEAAMSALMNTCGAYGVQVWEQAASKRWMASIGESYRYHRCRLWYSYWFTGQAPSSEYLGQMTQSQLLASLPAFVAELRRLASEQAPLGSLVLELAQHLEYVASQVPFASSELNFHDRVQTCYAQASSLFELVRDLTDLLQGIGIIETSAEVACIRGTSAELEVDAIGRAMQLECLGAAQTLDAARTQMLEKAAAVERLNEDLIKKRAAHQQVEQAREDRARKLQGLCRERETSIAATAGRITQRVHRVLALLKAFDKFKAPPREKEGMDDPLVAAESDGSKSRRRRSAVASKGAAELDHNSATAFSFMENERLVRILLRNIKSAEHLKTLEGILDKHERNSSTLHGIVASIDHALRQFLVDAQPVQAHDSSSSTSSAADTPSSSARGSTYVGTTQSSLSEQNGAAVALPRSRLSRSYETVKALMAVKCALESKQGVAGAETAGCNLLDIANKLVQVCLKLFFEATELSDRLSSLETSPSGASDDDEGGDGPEDEDSFNVMVKSEVTSAASTGNAEVDLEPEISGESSSSNATHVQRKNRHGVQVLRRIEEKLCGQVLVDGETRALTVEEQASWLIDEATKADNLCLMYEGWTPWI